MRFAIGFAVLAFSSVAHAGFDVSVDTGIDVGSGDSVVDRGAMTVTASTTLCEKKPKICHDAASLVDDKAETAWCEASPGDGKGETITITFAKPEKIAVLFITPHFARSFALAEQNNRIASIEITTDAGTATADLEDVVPKVKKENGVHEVRDPCGCGDETCMSRDERISGGLGAVITFGQTKGKDFAEAPVTTKKIVITVKDIYRGTKYHDLCASTITLHRPEK
jgi:hypothetical protein